MLLAFLSSLLLLGAAVAEQPFVFERKIKFGRSVHKRASEPLLKRIRSAKVEEATVNLPLLGERRSLLTAEDVTPITEKNTPSDEAQMIPMDQSMPMSLSFDLMAFVEEMSMSFSMPRPEEPEISPGPGPGPGPDDVTPTPPEADLAKLFAQAMVSDWMCLPCPVDPWCLFECMLTSFPRFASTLIS